MAGRRTQAVLAVACLSVAASVTAVAVADDAARPLPPETVNVAVIAASAAAMAVLLAHRTPANSLWRVLLIIAVNGPLTLWLSVAAATSVHPSGALVASLWLLDVVLALPWTLFAGLFPDGHRPFPAWSAVVAAGTLLLLAVSVAAWLTAREGAPLPVPGHLPGRASGPDDGSAHAVLERAASVLTGLLPLVAVTGLGWRYRRSGPVVRQQIRVGIVGLTIGVMLEIALQLLPNPRHSTFGTVGTVVAVSLGQLAVSAALLRWRLWMVDQALPRAVVLSACSAAFTAAIVAGALLTTGRVGKSQVRVALVSAVVVTCLVQGYSRRLEPVVRRLAYGELPVGVGVLVGLSEDLATLDDRAAAERITEAARRGLAVPWAALWQSTARDEVHRLVATSGAVAGVGDLRLSGQPLPGTTSARLLGSDEDAAPWPAGTSAIAALGSTGQPRGWLAVAQRRGDPLTSADVELLAAMVRDIELARTNQQLSKQVAASVEVLRARAAELQVSRQRLVAAQDEERRRIERDLHDGAQHELITLAGRLRQLAGTPYIDPRTLRDVAGQAERAVFSLQDLARGIYPSVLTDHGVAAAVRSFAAGLPIDVALEVPPTGGCPRWPAPVEVALYFVAVESLGNSLKHAQARTASVTLLERGGTVVLEIHDDGCGFDQQGEAHGSGLQHMADRMAALSGTLAIESRLGGGTWVTAAVQCEPESRAVVLTDRTQTPAGTAGRLGPDGSPRRPPTAPA